jgi:uncharacterized membrane protein (DUF485 family)
MIDITPGSIFIVALLLMAQIQGLSLEANISQSYTDFYFRLSIMGIVSLFGMVAFGIYYFSNDEIWKIPTEWKVIITVGWIAFVSFMTLGGNQMVGVPKASAVNLQLTQSTELWTSSVIPGFTEDLFYLAGLPMAFAVIVMLLFDRFGWGVGTKEFMGISVVACLVAAGGYNIWVIPGFTTSHIPAYGNIQLAYAGAFIFAAGQSLVYLITGWFLPIAHIIHNLIVVYGSLYIVVAFFPLMAMPMNKGKVNVNRKVAIGLMVLMFVVLMTSGCLTAGQAVDKGINETVNITGNIIESIQGWLST